MDGIGERVGHKGLARGRHRVGASAVGRLDRGHSVLVVAVGYAIAPFKGVVRLAGVGRFVFDPAEVVVNGALAVGNNGLIVVLPFDELRSRRVEGHRNEAVGDRSKVAYFLQLEGGHVGLGREGGQGGALGEFKLLCCHDIAGFCPRLVALETEVDVEVVVVGTVVGHIGGHGEGKHATRCGCEGRQFDVALFDDNTVLQYLEIEGEVSEIDEGIVVAHDQALVVLAVVEPEGHVLVHLLDDVEFGSPLAFGSDHAVVDKVTLVRSGVVVAGGQLLDALFELLGVVDALIHPVPNATADAESRFFDDVPVFAEVTHTVAHGVVIFAHEERLVACVVVGKSLHVVQVRVHFGVEVRDAGEVTACIGGSLVVNGTGVEGTCCVVRGNEVVACARFVTERPENDGGVVAIALHHAHRAVDHGGFPGFLSGDNSRVVAAVCTVIVPVLVTFEVSFVHDVEAIVVEHGVHFGLTGVV